MISIASGSLGKAFRGSTQAAAYREMVRRHQKAEEERRERKQEELQDADAFFDLAMTIVSSAEIDAFRVDLDRYDTATVIALQQNEQDLAMARQRLDDLLLKAHVLPDGRRVFKTEDGTRVFDEHGLELDAELIEPDVIDDHKPRWETFKSAVDDVEALEQQRAELLDYQTKLDAARERLDEGELTREEFDHLRDDLQTDMPEAVRLQFPELAADSAEPSESVVAEPVSEQPADDLIIDDDMVPLTPARGLTPT